MHSQIQSPGGFALPNITDSPAPNRMSPRRFLQLGNNNNLPHIRNNLFGRLQSTHFTHHTSMNPPPPPPPTTTAPIDQIRHLARTATVRYGKDKIPLEQVPEPNSPMFSTWTLSVVRAVGSLLITKL
jgi:hypothetical protein